MIYRLEFQLWYSESIRLLKHSLQYFDMIVVAVRWQTIPSWWRRCVALLWAGFESFSGKAWFGWGWHFYGTTVVGFYQCEVTVLPFLGKISSQKLIHLRQVLIRVGVPHVAIIYLFLSARYFFFTICNFHE